MIRLTYVFSNAFLSRGSACHDSNVPVLIPNANCMDNQAMAISFDMASSA